MFLGIFCKGVKIYHFSIEIILGNLYRHLAIFSGHTVLDKERPTYTIKRSFEPLKIDNRTAPVLNNYLLWQGFGPP